MAEYGLDAVPENDDNPEPFRVIPIWGEGGNKIVAWGKVSLLDYPELKKHKWWLNDGYVNRSIYRPDGSKTTVPMHREVMSVQIGDEREVDHINRDRLDNRRSNLRICNRYENEYNKPRDPNASSRKIGVTWDRARGKWKAQASLDGVYMFLGLFEDEIDAIAARMAWEDRHDRVREDERRNLMSVPPPQANPMGNH